MKRLSVHLGLSAAGGAALGALAAAADELWTPLGDLLSITGPFLVALWCVARASARAGAGGAAGRAAACMGSATLAYYLTKKLGYDASPPSVGYFWLVLSLTAAPAAAALLCVLQRPERAGRVNAAAAVAGWVVIEPLVVFAEPIRLVTAFSIVLAASVLGEAVAREGKARLTAAAAFAVGVVAGLTLLLALRTGVRAV